MTPPRSSLRTSSRSTMRTIPAFFSCSSSGRISPLKRLPGNAKLVIWIGPMDSITGGSVWCSLSLIAVKPTRLGGLEGGDQHAEVGRRLVREQLRAPAVAEGAVEDEHLPEAVGLGTGREVFELEEPGQPVLAHEF